MKLTAFEGNKGDCILLESANGTNILVDGGHVDPHFHRIFSYHFNVAPTLSQLEQAGKPLHLVCVSHIDQDHIGGILSMLDDEFAWRVFRHQETQGLPVQEPQNPRPPEIRAIWHNSFHEQVNLNQSDIEDALAAAARVSLAMGGGPMSHGHDLFGRLANSMSEAARVSRRIGSRQLGIPLNPEFDGKLVMRRTRTGPAFDFGDTGDVRVTVLGPNKGRLDDLRDKWNTWLKSTKGKDAIRKILDRADIDEDLLANGDLSGFLLSLAADLGPAIGDRDSVTEQNIASIVMMVEEDGKRMLFTGDALDTDIVDDLIDTGFADADGHIHVDVLKLQHHASENNFSIGFGKCVTADHYVFCGNGKHENPDRDVVKRVLDSRVGPSTRLSPNPETGNKFKLWFTSDGSTFKANRDHMKKVQADVKAVHDKDPSRFDVHFSKDAFLSFTI